MALTSALPPTTVYPEEPKEYITSATLNLKPYRRSQSLNHDDRMEDYTFEWHTIVTTDTPPNTPVVPTFEKPVNYSPNESSYPAIPEHSRDLFLPAFTYNEEDNLPTKVDKFMACERYHSQYQQAMAKGTTTSL
ncbi:hypothetical protein FF38_10819 [Lucilia cuprina]|uniref:Uncharacterized protein n=1 Tax=Lucilia cuprina TaxID=7375 RepID=A0A0L0CQU4_LUCCU|nr:hypothetical protein FF38_10819 [Lucilia cuprina]